MPKLNAKRVLFFLLISFILFFVDKFTLIPIWLKNTSPFLAYFANIIFVIVISVVIVIFFIDDIVIDNALIDIDNKDLERLYKTLQEIASVDGQIPIQALAKTWQDKDTPKQKLEKLLSKDDIDIDISQLNIYWRNLGTNNEIQASDQFSSSFTIEMFNNISSFIKAKIAGNEKHINNLYKPYLDLIMYLFKTLDTKGFVPSLVDARINSRDPDVLRKDITISKSNQYELLSQINLIDHTSRVVNNVLKNCKEQKSSIDVFIIALIAALAHDIGKIPNYYEQIGNNNTAHPQVSAELVSNTTATKSINDKILNIILDSILKHHNAEKISVLPNMKFEPSMYAKNYIIILESKDIVKNTDADYISSISEDVLDLSKIDVDEKEIKKLFDMILSIVVKADEKARTTETKIMQKHLLSQSSNFPDSQDKIQDKTQASPQPQTQSQNKDNKQDDKNTQTETNTDSKSQQTNTEKTDAETHIDNNEPHDNKPTDSVQKPQKPSDAEPATDADKFLKSALDIGSQIAEQINQRQPHNR